MTTLQSHPFFAVTRPFRHTGFFRHHLMCLLLAPLFLLTACGSSDRFPGTNDKNAGDPLVADIPLFYIERPLRHDDTQTIEADDLADPLRFHGNAHLYMKHRADQSAPSIDLSARILPGNMDVRDLDVSPDGERVAFALRAPPIDGADEADQPTWNLWQYDVPTGQLKRLIDADEEAEKGHDISPRYLPDGRIIFASTRQDTSRALLTDDGKPGDVSYLGEDRQNPALNLHVLDPRLQTITQLTFHPGMDLYPVVMPGGTVVFSRREFANGNALSLYEMNPDGTNLHLLYGHHSQRSSGTETRFIASGVLPDGSLFAQIRPDRSEQYGGDFVRIDTARYIDNHRPVQGGNGPAQTSITGQQVDTGSALSPGGHFSAYFPLRDSTGRALVSWSHCRVTLGRLTLPCHDTNIHDPLATPAPAAYGIWLLNPAQGNQTPIVAAREGVVYSAVALASKGTAPAALPHYRSDPALVEDGMQDAALHIHNVQAFDGQVLALDETPVYLRITRAVSDPPDDTPGANFDSRQNAGGRAMRELIGHVPIASDGSVLVKIPAELPLALSLVGADGKTLRHPQTGEPLQHESWISLRPGETLQCQGCHTRTSTAPHGRDSVPPATTDAGQAASSGIPALTHDLAQHPALDYTQLPQASDPAQNPASRTCLHSQHWSSGCPVIINYPQHIQPVWEQPRTAPGSTTDRTCTNCHNSAWIIAHAASDGTPATALELTGETEEARLRSYNELLTARPLQQVADGRLQDCTALLDGPTNRCPLDADGNPVTQTQPPLSLAGARANPAFFNLFGPGGSHAGDLTAAELRLLSEWLDLGAQFYNNPFDAPEP